MNNEKGINNCSQLTQEPLRYHNKRIAISKEFTFDAAHNLINYNGKCRKLHGHTYRLIITLSSYLKQDGISIDFGDIKEIFERAVNSKLDHEYLNDVLPNMNPTAENMIVWIWEQIEDTLRSSTTEAEELRIEKLTLYETPTSFVTITREWMV